MSDSQTNSRSIRNLTSPEALASWRRELENLRQLDKVDWKLNREFYRGNQWVFWNKSWPGGGRMENEVADEGDKPRYKVRLTDNHILPGVQHYVAQLTKNRPIITGTPNSGSDRDLKAAQLATALWEYWWQPDQLALDAKLSTTMTDTALTQGYWHIGWDPRAGKSLTYMVTPDGKPLLNWPDEDLDTYRDELRQAAEQQGMDPELLVKAFTKTVMVGDISVKPLPGENVILDSTARSFEDAKFAIVIVNMDPDEVAVRWPKAKGIEADAVPGDEMLNLSSQPTTNEESSKSVRRVYYGYFQKSPVMPKGRHVVWVEGPNQILEDTDWQFPFNELPLAKFPGIERPNSSLDIPVTSAARPLNKEINRTVSQIVEHKNLTIAPQMLAPVGSLAKRLTNEPGVVVSYAPINGAIPQWRQIPTLPASVFDHLSRVESKIDRVFNRIPSQRDQLPARVDAEGSIDLIQEAVADQLAPTIRRLESALVRAGMLMVKLAQKYYTEPRLLKIKGPNGSVQVRKFMNADLEGGFSFHAEAGSGLPRTRAGKQQRIAFMLEHQLVDQRTALKYLDVADMHGVLAKAQNDEEQAYRTLEKIKKGEPVNVVAVQQAQMAVQQGINPKTQQPLQSPQEAQAVLQEAAMEPMPFEDPQIHLEVLSRYMSTIEFEKLDPQVQSQFFGRYSAMMQRNAEMATISRQMQAPVEKPRIALQLKGTTSAPVAAEILRESGVQVSDEQVAEPPLETWVTDSMDKTDTDSAGNDPLTEQEQMQSMQQDQQTHALKMAKAAHEVALAGAQSHSTDASGAHAEEMHQMQMRHAEEVHQAKLKQMRKAPSGG